MKESWNRSEIIRVFKRVDSEFDDEMPDTMFEVIKEIVRAGDKRSTSLLFRKFNKKLLQRLLSDLGINPNIIEEATPENETAGRIIQ